MIKIRQVDGGYIVEWTHEYVFLTFNDVVQWMARHFSEISVGETWEPKDARQD